MQILPTLFKEEREIRKRERNGAKIREEKMKMKVTEEQCLREQWQQQSGLPHTLSNVKRHVSNPPNISVEDADMVVCLFVTTFHVRLLDSKLSIETKQLTCAPVFAQVDVDCCPVLFRRRDEILRRKSERGWGNEHVGRNGIGGRMQRQRNQKRTKI